MNIRGVRRSMLFVPGIKADMIGKAAKSCADSIILDLEDSVDISGKSEARKIIAAAMKSMDFSDKEIVVRINPLGTCFGYEDIKELIGTDPDYILVPKATEADIREIESLLGKLENKEKPVGIFVLIETAYGIENAYEIIKSSSRIAGAMLGAEDLTNDLGIERTGQGDEIFYARSKIVMCCRACKVDAIDTPFTGLKDSDGLIADSKKARALGMTGKAAIHPAQLEIINSLFSPTEKEVEYAKKIIEANKSAVKECKAAFSLDGKMIDVPVVAKAMKTLEKAGICQI